jgi:MFS family permease
LLQVVVASYLATTPPELMPAFLETVGRTGLSKPEWAKKESWIVASLLLAAVISDRFGRKRSIMVAFLVTAGKRNYRYALFLKVMPHWNGLTKYDTIFICSWFSSSRRIIEL